MLKIVRRKGQANQMINRTERILLGICCTLLLVFAGCKTDQGTGSQRSSSLNVIATTGQINSALQRITEGTDARIKLFCGPGVDPHSFSASTNDVQAMIDSDLIVYNGFHLEAKLSEHLEDAFKDKAWAMSSAFPQDARLDWVEDGEIDPDAPFDPHIWNHLPGWSQCVKALADKLAEVDSKNADKYRANAAVYLKELEEVHLWAKEKLARLPKEKRTIVSAHDAFGYFALNYNMKTSAPLGVGNDAEADIKTMREISQKICDEKISAIFLETITSPKVADALAEACAKKGWQVTIIQYPLYSDDLGEEPPVDTFLGAFKSNVNLIFDSLNGPESSDE